MELKSLRLAELNQMKNNKMKNDRCSLYFEDGVRKIDLIIAYKNCSDENENRAKNETRQRFLQEIQENGLQFEGVYNCNSKKKTRNTLVTYFFNSSFLEHQERYGSFSDCHHFHQGKKLENEVYLEPCQASMLQLL